MPPENNLPNKWLALFRGINVGGSNLINMKELVATLEGLGFVDVVSYIQSGNVVFASGDAGAEKIEALIVAQVNTVFGFEPRVLVLSEQDVDGIITANPYSSEADDDPKTVHCFFLAEVPTTPNLDVLNEIKGDSEAFVLQDRAFYLHAPGGIGRSRLVQRVEKLLGVATTARNWRTVTKVAQMLH